MCLFTHFAAGALAGGATGNVYAGAVAGLASHAVLDAIPHYDHPDWRLELSGGIASLILLLLLPFGNAAAIVGGVCGMLPDLENLFQKLGWMGRKRFVFPSHTGLVPHGRELGPRSLVWQVAIFVACFALLGLVAPDEAVAARRSDTAVMAKPVVRTLSADPGRTVVRVEFPVASAPRDWGTVVPGRVRWAGGVQQGRDGEPDLLPSQPVTLAVPARRAPQVRISGVEWWRRPAGAADLEGLLVAGPPAVQRGVPVTGVRVPVSVGGGVLAGVTLEFLHPADDRGRGQLAAGAVLRADADKGVRLPDLRMPGIANPDLQLDLAAGDLALARSRRARAGKAGPTDLFALTANWVRLGVEATGLYRITGQQLENLGISTADVDPAKLRVYRGGGVHLHADPELPDAEQSRRIGLNEVAIRIVETVPDGEWNLEDELRFYGVASSAYLDRLVPGSDRTIHYDHPACARAVYWLTWESDAVASPLPGMPRRVVEAAAPAGAGPLVTAGTVRVHEEEQFFDERGVVADNWVWEYNVTPSEPAVEHFRTHRPVAGSTARFQVEVRTGSRSEQWATAHVNSDEAAADTIRFRVNTTTSQDRFVLAGETLDIMAGQNELALRNIAPVSTGLVFDSFDVFYEDSLVLEAAQGALEFGLWGDGVAAPGTAENLRIATTVPAQTILWDVTVPDSAVVLVGTAGAAHVDWEVLRDPGVDRFFAAARDGDVMSVDAATRGRPQLLADFDTDIDYLVVAPSAFMSAAEDLAAFRSRSLPGVASPRAATVDVQAIYDNFSGGQKDVLAVRNFLKWVYEQGGHRLHYVCLLGNGSRDPRNHRGATPFVDRYDLVPTGVRTNFPGLRLTHTIHDAYASDDELVAFDAPAVLAGSPKDRDLPDVCIGRLPALNPAEAASLVARVVAYGEDPPAGDWRNRVLLVSDDCDVPDPERPYPLLSELFHVDKAEDVAELLLPAALDLVKVYGVDYEFPPGSNIKSAAQRDVSAALDAGATIFYYVGHGSEDNLGDEQYFRTADIGALVNGAERPLFVAFSCDVGVYDSFVTPSMAEIFVKGEAGGSIMSICASQVSYIQQNEVFTDRFFGSMYPDPTLTGLRDVGTALLMAKGLAGDPWQRNNDQRYNILGDPATRLPHPEENLVFAAATLDTLRPGLLQRIVLDGAAQSPLVGAGDAWDLRVEESERDAPFTVWYQEYDDVLERLVWVSTVETWVRRGGPAFRNAGVLGGPDLDASFKAATQARVGPRGRLRLIVDERVAVQPVPVERADLSAVDDAVGPQIELNFADNRTRVTPGATLTATLRDTSSIAVLGNAPGNSINLEFDDSGFWTDVTGSFSFDPDDHTRGELAFGLPPDLVPGRHVAALYAADVHGNVGADTLGFTLLAGSESGIFDVTLFPNPTPGPCRLVFELSTAMNVRWDIYTTAGRRVRTMREGVLAAGPRIIHWDGRDNEGDEMANGTYLYVLRGLGGGHDGSDLIRTGKLVIMR